MGLSETDLQQLFRAMFEDLAENKQKLNGSTKPTEEALNSVFEEMITNAKSKDNEWFNEISDGLGTEANVIFDLIVDAIVELFFAKLKSDILETVFSSDDAEVKISELFKNLSNLTKKHLDYYSLRFPKPLVFKPARVVLPAIKQTTEIQRVIRSAYVDDEPHTETGFYHQTTGRYFPSHSEQMQRLNLIAKTNRAKFNTRFSGFYN